MRLITNDKLIERQAKIARYATFGGLAVLLGSLVTSFSGNFPIVVAYGLLFVGFGLAYVGAMLANKWIKEPRADNALAKALKGLDNKNQLYNYLLPANHVLLTPTGLLVFKVKSNDGKIT
ncbi:MAG: nuclease-related domain-containing protein, partial [Acidobacteriota bacterium]